MASRLADCCRECWLAERQVGQSQQVPRVQNRKVRMLFSLILTHMAQAPRGFTVILFRFSGTQLGGDGVFDGVDAAWINSVFTAQLGDVKTPTEKPFADWLTRWSFRSNPRIKRKVVA